ncbi:MAG: pilus assembly protein PilY, partial [Gammaproteobacteria bacterium]|nr:pilus assembly protein PilY [Gammaproteobacteria bacterium]
WQHMVTFGVGLGVTGSINPDTAWDALETGATINWPNPTSNSAKLDDLLHAAVNGRGGFFSAADPNAFAEGLIEVLRAIVARVEASATASATSSSVLLTESKSYEAGFRSGDWTGTFRSYEISGAGTKGTLIWDAEDKLRSMSPAARKIFTHSGTGGVPFQHSSLSSAQQAALSYDAENTQDNLGAERVAWLRGTETLSLPTGISFRSRTESGSLRLLGDIVNANPQYAGKANLGFGQLGGAEGGSYADFRKDSRPDVVYVGANDGMMHAFDALTGVELFAYIPGELLRAEGGRSHAPVSRLMATDYTHRYFVDGTPAISDAYIGGTWKSVLLGAMGAGGKTVYALDVTEPTGFDQTKVMWEFTHPDLGYGVTNPAIVRMADGRWAAVFGNGYNSTSHKAMLFIVDLATGALISKVDTGVGSAGT